MYAGMQFGGACARNNTRMFLRRMPASCKVSTVAAPAATLHSLVIRLPRIFVSWSYTYPPNCAAPASSLHRSFTLFLFWLKTFAIPCHTNLKICEIARNVKRYGWAWQLSVRLKWKNFCLMTNGEFQTSLSTILFKRSQTEVEELLDLDFK